MFYSSAVNRLSAVVTPPLPLAATKGCGQGDGCEAVCVCVCMYYICTVGASFTK